MAFSFAGIHVDCRRCRDCGFIFTGFFDDCTPDEFAAYVYNADYPRIDSQDTDIRPGNVAAMLADRLGPWRDIDILDYGSGAFAERACLQDLASFLAPGGASSFRGLAVATYPEDSQGCRDFRTGTYMSDVAISRRVGTAITSDSIHLPRC